MTKTYCDICGSEIIPNDENFKSELKNKFINIIKEKLKCL